MALHRRKPARKYIKKAAALTGSAATATVMTVGMAAPPANAADTGPDYSQIITDSSNSLNNFLIEAGNLGGEAAAYWDSLATGIPGGLLPTFTAGTTQNNLTSLAGILAALSDATELSGVPGLPTDASTTILAGLLSGLDLGGADGALPILTSLVDAVSGQLGTVGTVLKTLSAIPFIGGVPSLGDLLGLTATQTTFDSAYNWGLLGVSGSTTLSNTFAQLPSLTASSLVSNILSGLTLDGVPVNDVGPLLPTDLLTALDAINTPSVTAWLPAGSGVYGLPLGGSIGWLATMPTVDVGPIDIVGIPVSTTDTVLAVPLVAEGAVLPLGLASFGTVTTPGVVFPTATGVSTLGGTSLTSLAIPIVGLSMTNLNTLAASYVGTNGVNYNSGTSELTLTTPLGALPIVYSLGSFDIGTTGFGFTGPSLFGVGLLPPFQVGTAPTQQSPDGIIPATVLNQGLATPTQTTTLSPLAANEVPQSNPQATTLNKPATQTATVTPNQSGTKTPPKKGPLLNLVTGNGNRVWANTNRTTTVGTSPGNTAKHIAAGFENAGKQRSVR